MSIPLPAHLYRKTHQFLLNPPSEIACRSVSGSSLVGVPSHSFLSLLWSQPVLWSLCGQTPNTHIAQESLSAVPLYVHAHFSVLSILIGSSIFRRVLIGCSGRKFHKRLLDKSNQSPRAFSEIRYRS